jgi:hypothetical protein
VEAYHIKIVLLDTHPPVWRRVLVPREITLRQLHRIVQTVVGWTDSHIHQFIFKGQRYSDPKYRLELGVIDERKTKLSDLIFAVGNRLLYEYDFGDSWRHDLRLENALVQNDSFRSICVAGERACPPEDCGGPSVLLNYWKYLGISTTRNTKTELSGWEENLTPSASICKGSIGD